MPIIGPEEAEEFDDLLRNLVMHLQQQEAASIQDKQDVGDFLAWVIYPGWEEADALDTRSIEWSDGLKPSQRQSLAEVACAAADFHQSGVEADKQALLASLRHLAKQREVQLPPPRHAAGGERANNYDARHEPRDKYVYEQLQKGVGPRSILSQIEQHPNWDLLSNADELRSRALQYARHNSLPPPRGC